MTLVKRVICRQKGEEVIKLVKFLLLIVLIAPTSTYAQPLRCEEITQPTQCTNTEGCGLNGNQCTECGVGYYSGSQSDRCSKCTNGPDDEATESGGKGTEYLSRGRDNGNNKCAWMYTCETNEQVSCTKKDDNDWTCICETCVEGGSYQAYYSYDSVSGLDYISDGSYCTVGANTVVLKMPSNNTHYEDFPTEEDGYLFFTPTNTSANLPTTPPTTPSTKASTKASIEIQTKDTFSLGINNGTAHDLEIKKTGDNIYEWSWKDRYNSSIEGNVAVCEVRDWTGTNTACGLFGTNGALDYPFAWESEYRLRPDRYYVKKGIAEIDVFKLVTNTGSGTFYAFANDRSKWGDLFECNNSTNGKCTYYLHAGDWQFWPYTDFSIKYGGNKPLFQSSSWDIDDGFNFKNAFKTNNYCVDGEEMPSRVVIQPLTDPYKEWTLTADIPENGILKIVPPSGYSFNGKLTIATNGTVTCPVGYYCNNCEKSECPAAFTSAAGASSEEHCYIKPTITFTEGSAGGKGGTKEFGLPACDSTDPDKCVGGKIKVYINTSLE